MINVSKIIRKYWFVMPAIILVTLLVAFPVFYTLWISFYENIGQNGIPYGFVGLKNFANIFLRGRFLGAFGRTTIFVFFSIVFKVSLGLAVAMLFNRKFPGRNVIRGIVILPWVLPLFVTALIWYAMFTATGPINSLLTSLHLPTVNWWGQRAMLSIIIVNVWKGFPFFFMGFLSGLQGISEKLYEAAKVDGASPLQSFRHITLPQLRPVLLILTLLSTIWTFAEFVDIHIMTRGGPANQTEVLSILIYNIAFNEFNTTLAAAASVVILPLYVVLILSTIKILSQE